MQQGPMRLVVVPILRKRLCRAGILLCIARGGDGWHTASDSMCCVRRLAAALLVIVSAHKPCMFGLRAA